MFTGIVQGKAEVVSIQKKPLLHRIHIRFPSGALHSLKQGASISINGTCLTVAEFNIENNEVVFDVMQQSLKLTNLGLLAVGDLVNFERAAKIGDEIGGHLMSGHIFTTCNIKSIKRPDNNTIISFDIPEEARPFLFNKGFVGLNGCSLTIAEIDDTQFSVYLIPETLAVTTFGLAKEGDTINLEVDPQTQTIVETLKKMGFAPQANKTISEK